MLYFRDGATGNQALPTGRGAFCTMPQSQERPDIIIVEGSGGKPGYRRWLFLAGLLFIGFLLYHNAVPLYTDWLWFGEVGYRNVFGTVILAKTTLFFLFALVFFVLFYGNAWLARRLAPENADRFLLERFGPAWSKSLTRSIGWILLGVSLFLSLWAGRLGADNWSAGMEFLHGAPFGVKDPIFLNDVGFYVFRLPLLRFCYSFGIGALLLTFLAVVMIHVADRAIETWAGLPDIKRSVRSQLLTLLAALAFMQAFGTYLDRFGLLTNENGLFTGGGYADMHYRLFAFNLQILLLGATGLACLASIGLGRDFRWPVYGVVGWGATILLLGNAVPAIVQKTIVEPNQFDKEQEYIRRNIAFTRQGFGLEEVTQVNSFTADTSLNAAGIRANRDTLDNVRLWDYDYLGKVYSQLQAIKPYYKFSRMMTTGGLEYNIDIDRYPINGKPRQVMLAAREMDNSNLPASAQTWQNQKLAYTHGYGVAMSPVNKIVNGQPDYFISGIPLTASAEAANVKVTRPQIYYGQLDYNYVFVDTEQKEFDYPSTGNGASGSQDMYTVYQGHGGIRIGDAPLAKWAFSLRLGDALMLLQNGFKPSTRLLFRRDIRERLQTVAPFVQQDHDPYLVVNPDNGRLVWVIDCYTLSDDYPYSTPQEMNVDPIDYIAPNYIRNSIKATIDAYDGDINLYIVDEKDPIAKTYATIFPGLLKPFREMPAGLRAHLRYPEDLFRLQRSVYASYHVDDPRVFYLKEDAWAIPIEPNADVAAGNSKRQMEPYYIITRLPDLPEKQAASATMSNASSMPRSEEEFVLMSPLSPINREGQNILGWMCARCDPGHYGQLVLYRFPQSASVAGPTQIVQLINSDRVISPQLSLLRSGGSTASLGNLLVIPVDKSLLYIAPLYIEATNSATKLPQLQKVVVAFDDQVAMEDTLDKALADLFPGEGAPPPTETPSGPATPQTGSVSGGASPLRSLIEQASAQYDSAQKKLKAGDFAGYGASMKDLERTLGELRRASGMSSAGHSQGH